MTSTHMLRTRLLAWWGACLLAAMLWWLPVHAQGLAFVDAEFSVYINNKQAHGTNHLHIRHQGQRYEIDFAFDHSLLSIRQEAEFNMQGCRVEPLQFRDTTRPALGRERRQMLEFDSEHQRAVYRQDDEEKTFDLDHRVYDPISLFFEARCELMHGSEAFSYPVIRKGSQKTQRFQVVGRQTVATGQGEVDTLVVERQRRRNKRQTRFYVAPELDYLLVMIEHRESRLMTITALLDHMDYELTAP